MVLRGASVAAWTPGDRQEGGRQGLGGLLLLTWRQQHRAG